MPKTHSFIVKEHEEYGFIGLVDKSRPDFDPAQGMGIAHDLLEHPPLSKSNGNSLANEFMAFGAWIYIRLQFDKNQYRSKRQTFKDSVMMLLIDEHLYKNEPFLSYTKSTKSLNPKIEEIIGGVFDLSFDDFEVEIGDEDSSKRLADFIKNHASSIVSWTRLGYRWAVNKYKEYDAYDLYLLAKDIEKTVDAIDFEFVDEVKISLDFNYNKCYTRLFREGLSID